MIDKQTIEENLDFVLSETHFPALGEKKVGKVRDVYVHDDHLVLIATDRYSAFDRNLALVPFKGQVLNRTAAFWFDKTKDIIHNHVIVLPDPNVIVAKKCQVLPIEVVVRGFITGVTDTALWTLYQNGQRDFGSFTLPDGMKKNQRLDAPVITPTTKNDVHDEVLLPDEVVSRGIVDENLWKEVQKTALALFARGQEVAQERGLILVDTKYEFGLDENGALMLIDEIHTPDSSRYWQLASYDKRFGEGREPEYFDKEFLRLWFKENSDPYKDETLPDAPQEMIAELSHRYGTIFETLTGEQLDATVEKPISERIEANLKDYL